MPAPIDRAKLDEVLRPFGESRLLPREAYVDPEVFAFEHEQFIRNQWVCIARGEEIPARGDQRAISIGKDSVLLVRGDDLWRWSPAGRVTRSARSPRHPQPGSSPPNRPWSSSASEGG